ncbi:MAG: baseplate J/gp47 family protein, partial [Methylomonas sp.]
LPDAATGEDSDYAVRASGEAAAIEGLYQHQAWIARQIFPDKADVAELEHHAQLHGVPRKQATASARMIRFSGSVSSNIPIGTEAKTSTGIAFVTTTAGTIGAGGTADVLATASLAGISGNISVGTAMTLSAAPTGILSAASVVAATTDGTDIETPESLLARLLFVLQNPPQGGSKDDYKSWALAVPGVGYAYIYGQRRAANSVDIVILETDGSLPSTALINTVQAEIDVKRNVTADCWVFGPTAVPVAVTAALTLSSGVLLADVTPFINASLSTYFLSLKPGDTVIKNKIINLILAVSGVVDVNLIAPAANVATLVDATHVQLATLGTVTLS